jgi:hypothetical protein
VLLKQAIKKKKSLEWLKEQLSWVDNLLTNGASEYILAP